MTNNKEFESTNLMIKTQVFNECYVYFLDTFDMKCNGFDITTLYIRDMKIKLNEYTKIIDNTDEYYIFEFNYDGTPRLLKGFKSKDLAQHEIDKRKPRGY